MPNAAWSEFLPRVLPFAPGCPDDVAEDAVRQKAIEFCKRTRTWRIDLDPIDQVANQYLYDLTVGSGQLVTDVVMAEYLGLPFAMKTPDELALSWPGWRLATSTAPQCFYLDNERQMRVVGIPTTAVPAAFTMRVALKPTIDATSIDSVVFEDNWDAIAAGALAYLLAQPKKDWSDKITAGEKKGDFEKGVMDARLKARKAYMSAKSLGAKPRQYGFR